MKVKDWEMSNERSHYKSLIRQDFEHRKLIKSLQLKVGVLEQQLKASEGEEKPCCGQCGLADIEMNEDFYYCINCGENFKTEQLTLNN